MKSEFGNRFLLFAALFLSSCAMPKVERYKVTLNVEDNGTLYSASGVQEVKCTPSNSFWQGMSMGGCRLKGEAIPLKVGDKGYLFLILAGENGGNALEYYYSLTNDADEQRKKSKVWDVNLKNAPMLVTFDDLNDCKTVKAVYPVDKDVIDHYMEYRPKPYAAMESKPIMKFRPSNIHEIFGDGVSLKSIHVERTNEHITFGQIEMVLPWIVGKNTSLNMNGGLGSYSGEGLINSLQISNFKSRS